MIIKVLVKKGKGEIIQKDDQYIVFTEEEFENNKANVDVIKKIAKYFNKDFNEIKILKGLKQRKKIIEIK